MAYLCNKYVRKSRKKQNHAFVALIDFRKKSANGGKRAKVSKITDFALLNELSQEIIALEEELIDEPHFTRLFADDVTPESLGVVLENQGGKLAIAEAEGGFFSILAGTSDSRYFGEYQT